METIQWIVTNIPTDILLTLIIVFLFFDRHNTKKVRGEILEDLAYLKKNYSEHIKKSTQTDREVLRGKIRRLHLEMGCSRQAGKDIKEQVIEEFYSAFDVYITLGGNGYIKHLKEEVDEWLEEQRHEEKK